jgi:hypothetical protein
MRLRSEIVSDPEQIILLTARLRKGAGFTRARTVGPAADIGQLRKTKVAGRISTWPTDGLSPWIPNAPYE